MKKTKTLWLMGAVVLVAGMMTACGGGSGSNGAEAEAAALPTDGILGELPKAVADYHAAEAAASAKYDELKKSDPEKAKEFWKDYLSQNNTLKFKKETLPTLGKALEGKEIPTEVADGLPIKLDKNLTLDGERYATTTGVFTAEASKETKDGNLYPVAFDTDGHAIAVSSKSIDLDLRNWPPAEGKQFKVNFFISINDYDAAGWARLQKVVIMDKESEAYKQAAEAIAANRKAFKEKGQAE